MAGSVINSNASVEYSIIDEDTEIGCNSKIGQGKANAAGITVIAKEVKIGDGITVTAGAMVDYDILV